MTQNVLLSTTMYLHKGVVYYFAIIKIVFAFIKLGVSTVPRRNSILARTGYQLPA